MNKSILYCAAVTLILSGCAQQPRYAAQSPCNRGVCKVLVTVDDCNASGGIWVNVDPVPVDKPNKIEWTMDTEGFRFADKGIVIARDQNVDFDQYMRVSNGKKFTVRDRYKTQRVQFKYTINVVRDDGSSCAPYDPTIWH